MFFESAEKQRLTEFTRRLTALETDADGEPVALSGYWCIYIGKTYREAQRNRRRESGQPWASGDDPAKLAELIEQRISVHAEGRSAAWVDAYITDEAQPFHSTGKLVFDARTEEEIEEEEQNPLANVKGGAIGVLGSVAIEMAKINKALTIAHGRLSEQRLEDAHTIGFLTAAGELGDDQELKRALIEQVPHMVDLLKTVLPLAFVKRGDKSSTDDESPAGQLVTRIEEACQELGSLAQQNPEAFTPAIIGRIQVIVRTVGPVVGLTVSG